MMSEEDYSYVPTATERYYCPVCDNNFPKPSPEYFGSTEDNCKGCHAIVEKARELLRPQSPTYGAVRPDHKDIEMPSRIAITLINAGRALEAINFCLSSLDISSPACPAHPSYDRRAALSDLTRYAKSDLNPDLPPAMDFGTSPAPGLLYALSLAAFKVYGPSPFAAACLRRAYNANPGHYHMICHNAPLPTFKIDINSIYLFWGRVWDAPETQKWLTASGKELFPVRGGEVKKGMCNARGCGKGEGTVGALKMCGRCRNSWYCGAECQKQDWHAGGHKAICRNA